MVIARALPDSPVPPNMLIFYVFSDPLDRSVSKCCCASDGDSEGSPRQPCTHNKTTKHDLYRTMAKL
eukprot:4464534-Heterocapsa_arctica.AAC.1